MYYTGSVFLFTAATGVFFAELVADLFCMSEKQVYLVSLFLAALGGVLVASGD
jgi:hypothetical protein